MTEVQQEVLVRAAWNVVRAYNRYGNHNSDTDDPIEMLRCVLVSLPPTQTTVNDLKVSHSCGCLGQMP